MSSLKQALSQGAQLIETHTAWVFLYEDVVLKVKKPVNFGFLDFTSLDKRRRACDAELRLNRRLAPEVYLSVVPITRQSGGGYAVDGAGEVVDFAVRMQRLADEQRADCMLKQARLGAAHIEKLAIRLAGFHADMPGGAEIARFGTLDVLLAHVQENFDQTADTIQSYISDAEAREIRERQLQFIEAHRDLLIARALSGKVRDGHGDLRLEHVYFADESSPTIIDCIEFNDRFRYADVCADIAFLSMDLARLGRVDLAERLLAVYAREANDFDLYPLVDYYEGYRAFVRAKVASMLVEDADAPFAAREEAKRQARRHYLLALSSGRQALIAPCLVAVAGPIASGKSTVAEQVAEMLSAPVVSSDRTRKHLLGLTPTSSADQATGAYSAAFSERVYAELFRRGACVLTSGRPVVLDASFRTRELRGRARLLASSYGVPVYFVECRTAREVLLERLRRRAGGEHVSDAREGLLDEFLAGSEPVDEFAPSEHVVLDTTLPLADNVKQLAARLPSWPQGLTQ